MAHSKSEWNALKESLAQCEYEREDARCQWKFHRERADALEKAHANLAKRITGYRDALNGLLAP